MSKLPISVTLITFNEAARIEAAIQSVQDFASEIIVVDSGSSDRTVEIAQSLGAQVHEHPFAGFGQQKNRAHQLTTQPWVLNIDADERVSSELELEIRGWFKRDMHEMPSGFWIPRKTWYLNRWVMHGGWYPNHLLRLARRDLAKWTEPELHESLQVNGTTERFKEHLEHWSIPSQRAHILKNVEYADRSSRAVGHPGLFHFVLKPIWKFFDMYIRKHGFMDGMAGFFIAVHSSYAVFLRYTYRYEQSLKDSDHR